MCDQADDLTLGVVEAAGSSARFIVNILMKRNKERKQRIEQRNRGVGKAVILVQLLCSSEVLNSIK